MKNTKKETGLSAGEHWLLFLTAWPMLTIGFRDWLGQKIGLISIVLWGVAFLATTIIGMMSIYKETKK